MFVAILALVALAGLLARHHLVGEKHQAKRREQFALAMNRYYYPGTNQPIPIPACTDVQSFPGLLVGIEYDEWMRGLVLAAYYDTGTGRTKRARVIWMSKFEPIPTAVKRFAETRAQWVYADFRTARHLWEGVEHRAELVPVSA